MQHTLLTAREAAPMLHTTTSTLRNSYIAWGVPYVKVGGKVLFPKEKIIEWIGKNIKQDKE